MVLKTDNSAVQLVGMEMMSWQGYDAPGVPETPAGWEKPEPAEPGQPKVAEQFGIHQQPSGPEWTIHVTDDSRWKGV